MPARHDVAAIQEEERLWAEEMTRSARDYVQAFPPPPPSPESPRSHLAPNHMQRLREECEFLLAQSQSIVDAARAMQIVSRATRAAGLAQRRGSLLRSGLPSAAPKRRSGRS